MSNYYKGKTMESIEVIEWLASELQGLDAFMAGNVIKYLLRYDAKENATKDLEKAKQYLTWMNLDAQHGFIPLFIEDIIIDFKREKSGDEFEQFKQAIFNLAYYFKTGTEAYKDYAMIAINNLLHYVS